MGRRRRPIVIFTLRVKRLFGYKRTHGRARFQNLTPATIVRYDLASWTRVGGKTLHLSAERASRPVSRGGRIRSARSGTKHAPIPDAICRCRARQTILEKPLGI